MSSKFGALMYLLIKQFFEPVLCDAIVGEMKATEGSAATVYGRDTSGSIDTNVRSTLRVVPSSETIELVTRRLLSCKSAVEKHFGVESQRMRRSAVSALSRR